MRSLSKILPLVLVVTLALLIPIAPVAAHHDETELRFLVGSGLLCNLAANACPDVSRAANGDTIQLTGQGTISLDDSNDGSGSATGHGTFVHILASGETFAHGSWTARKLLSFTPYGSGSVQGLPANFQGGLAVLSINIRPAGAPGGTVLHGTLAIDCVLGNPPQTAHEGVTLTVPNLVTFDQKISGFTLFIADQD